MKKENIIKILIGVLLVSAVTILVYFIFNKKPTIKRYESSNYAIAYDSTWSLKEKKDDLIELNHKKNGTITVHITELEQSNSYITIDEIIDEVIYNLESQNKTYKLISKEEATFTKTGFRGYKLLYEDESKQVMVSIYKKSNKLITIIYEADTDYFDILLDSASNIIANLNVKDEEFDLNSKIDLTTEKIKYEQNDVLDKNIKKSQDIWIANNNYRVDLSIPDIFKSTSLNSSLLSYSYTQDYNSINITANIFNSNIYQDIENIQKQHEYYKNNADYYDIESKLDKLDSKYDSYVLSFKYKTKKIYNADENKPDYNSTENVYLLYALNNTHTLQILISSNNCSITQKLINNIKINKSTNYSSFLDSKINNGYINSELKWYKDYNGKETRKLEIKLPDKYKEVDKKQNVYKDRYYILGYNSKLDENDYEIHYQYIDSYNAESTARLINSYVESFNQTYSSYKAYGAVQKLSSAKNIELNDKTFKQYEGYYNNKSGIMFSNINRNLYKVNCMVLVYELPEKGIIMIDIKGNDQEIDEAILKDVTNFSLKEN